MKKIILLGLMTLLLTGCFKRDDLEDINIHTTVYPIEYLVERIYGDNSTVNSIYPNEVIIEDYELSDKQKNSASESPIFVYNGLTDEKDIAKDLLNINDELLIIDVSYGLKYSYAPEELWLSPNNYLMLATNIKNSLQEFIVNKIVKEEIDENYAILEEELSLLDAELRSIGNDAIENGKNTIIVNDPLFNYLNNYGFEIIDITNEETTITNLESNFENDTYKTIFVRDDKEISEELQSYITKYELEVITLDVMTLLDEEQRTNKSDYLTITSTFIEQIRNITN